MTRWTCIALLVLVAAEVLAAEAAETPRRPAIALIIDDLGNQLQSGEDVLRLPGAVTYAFLPHTPFARVLADNAVSNDKEVMLHLPMESENGAALGPGGLTLDMSEGQFFRAVRGALQSVPHVRGLNNHMGSLLTRHPGAMKWLMEALRCHGELYFVDSRTTTRSVALRLANESRIPGIGRDVFLDHERSSESIRTQFDRLVGIARRRGAALAIAHPYPETITVLQEVLPQLDDLEVDLVPVSRLSELKNERRHSWQAFSSLSPLVLKNSRP